MASDSSTIVNAQSVTAAAAKTSFVASTSLAAKAWKRFTLQATATNAATHSSSNRVARIWYAVTNESLASDGAGTIPAKLAPVAKFFEIKVPQAASAVFVSVSEPIDFTGDYLGLWVEHDEWDVAATLTVKAVELR